MERVLMHSTWITIKQSRLYTPYGYVKQTDTILAKTEFI